MAGFVDFEITWRKAVFDNAPQEGSAANFGTVGINFRARKPETQAEWEAALDELSCEPPPAKPEPIFDPDEFYDAGDLGCGYGPITEIAKIMKTLEPGQRLEVRATDPTVRVDLGAWCRLVGYDLLKQEGDRYLVGK